MMSVSSRVRATTIGDLLGDAAPPSARRVPIKDIAQDSRRVVPGSLFLAVAGETHHGLDFLKEAMDAGATAVAWEPSPEFAGPVVAPPSICFPVDDLRRRLGEIADRFFGAPSRRADVVGVTGTNGKTTCAYLIARALGIAGRKAGYMGTIGTGFPDHLLPSELTTADAIETHRRLARLVDDGATAAAMEVSSHALDQGRVQGVRFKAGVFTNLSREHLDYHGDMAAYTEAKRRLFQTPELKWAVANTDDPAGAGMLEAAGPAVRKVAVGSGFQSAADRNLVLREVLAEPGGMAVRLDGDWGEMEISSRLFGRFNADNLALALAVLLVMDVPAAQACSALSHVPAPPGRMEIFPSADSTGPSLVVDYAHTPDALEKALSALRLHCRGRLTVVFGCGGDRDRGKRPEMGRVAEELADVVMLTDDNLRSEDGGRIVEDIIAGMRMRPEVIRDREAAIRSAYGQSGEGDVVLVAGKGHEDYQIVGAECRRYSDRDVADRLAGGAA